MIMDALQALTTRVSPSQLAEPAPNDLAIEAMLRAGANAPDHARLRTSRFIVVSAEARSKCARSNARQRAQQAAARTTHHRRRCALARPPQRARDRADYFRWRRGAEH